MRFKWQKDGDEKVLEVADRFMGVVSYVGEDMYGNKMFDAVAFDNEKQERLSFGRMTATFTYEDEAKKAIEMAIKKAMEG